MYTQFLKFDLQFVVTQLIPKHAKYWIHRAKLVQLWLNSVNSHIRI